MMPKPMMPGVPAPPGAFLPPGAPPAGGTSTLLRDATCCEGRVCPRAHARWRTCARARRVSHACMRGEGLRVGVGALRARCGVGQQPRRGPLGQRRALRPLSDSAPPRARPRCATDRAAAWGSLPADRRATARGGATRAARAAAAVCAFGGAWARAARAAAPRADGCAAARADGRASASHERSGNGPAAGAAGAAATGALAPGWAARGAAQLLPSVLCCERACVRRGRLCL